MMEDSNDYRIQSLGITFSKHADQAEIDAIEMIKRFTENFPQTELPEHFRNCFNIARALSVMACEIERIKHFLGIKEIN